MAENVSEETLQEAYVEAFNLALHEMRISSTSRAERLKAAELVIACHDQRMKFKQNILLDKIAVQIENLNQTIWEMTNRP